MDGMKMETEGTSYKTTHCKECGMLFFVKSGSLNRYCDTCGKKEVLQIKKLLSRQRNTRLIATS